MKRNLLFLVALPALLIPAVTKANLYPVPFEERTRHANFIAEGIVESQHSFWNPDHTMIFTSSRIHITKLFSGAAGALSFDVLTRGGTVGNYNIQASHLLQLFEGDAGVFCAYPNTAGLQDPQTGAPLYDIWASAQGFFRYDNELRTAVCPFENYPDIATDLYPRLVAAAGHPYTVVDPHFTVSTRSALKTTGAITSYSPAVLRAGNVDVESGNLLTINGSGFGVPGANSAVLFAHGDYAPGLYSIAIGGLYNTSIKSWSDTKIEVRLPTQAATGVFSVRDAGNNIVATSVSPITVEYSVLTGIFGNGSAAAPFKTYEYNLMNANEAGGYSIEYSNNTGFGGADFSTGPVKGAFQRALATWKTLGGFNVTDNNTATSIYSVNIGDGHNVVMYDNTNNGVGVLPAGVLAVCYSGGSLCGGGATDGLQLLGFDIIVRSGASAGGAVNFTAGPCPPATPEYDLESVLLHELGHSIGQGHINDAPEGLSTFPNSNPSKVMHYAISNGLKRVSPDAAALAGTLYLTSGFPSHTYPACIGTFTQPMTQLASQVDAQHNCPTIFPAATPFAGTTITVDNSKAPSNKSIDPQYTVMSTSGTGTGITNTEYYPIRTNSTGGSFIRMNVSGYNSVQSGCGNNGGVEVALYQVSNCPGGQTYPTPVASRTFNANGTLTDITGLNPNTNYLLVMDGMNNSFSAFNLSFTGSTALPIGILSFKGVAEKAANHLQWSFAKIDELEVLELERSTDGVSFSAIGRFSRNEVRTAGSYDDPELKSMAYYRLKATGHAGEVTYSTVVSLRRNGGSSYGIAQGGPSQPMQLIANSGSGEAVSVVLSDAAGRAVWKAAYTVPAGESKAAMQVPTVAPGLYLVQVRGGNGVLLAAQKVSL